MARAAGSKRLNITIPVEGYALVEEAAKRYYGGNVSRYLTDAGLYYAGVLAGHEGRPAQHEDDQV